VVLSFIITSLSFFWELHIQSPFVSEIQASVLSLVDSSQSQNLAVSYKLSADGSDLKSFDSTSLDFPTYLKIEKDLSLRIYKDTYLIASAGTELRTLIFTKDKLHLHLITGNVVLDTRQSKKNILIQTNNVLLKPFLHGVFVLEKKPENTNIYSQVGQAILGVYSERGNLKDKILLAKKKSVSFNQQFDLDSDIAESQFQPLDFYKESQKKKLIRELDTDIFNKQALSLKYKDRVINPQKSKGLFSDLTKVLVINSTKRDFLSLYPFIQSLASAQSSYLSNEVEEGNLSLKQASQEYNYATKNSLQSISSFNRYIGQLYPLFLNLTPSDRLLPIKSFLIDTYSLALEDNIRESYQQKAVFSYLEDIYYYYQNDSIAFAQDTSERLQNLLNIWTPSDDETLNFVIQITDNILLDFPKSNNLATYNLRETFYKELSNDQFTKKYRLQNAKHLSYLQTYFEDKTIPSSYVKESIEILRLNLSDFNKQKYSVFFNEVIAKDLE